MNRAPLVLLATMLACGGSRRVAPVFEHSVPQEADLGLAELRQSLESTVLENYVQLTFGNIEAFLDGVAREREVQFLGVTPRDVLTGINPKGLGQDRRLYRHRELRILSKNLDVHLSEDGSVGWVYDEISYRVEYMGREASIPLRSTALYVRDAERWVLVAEHLSYGVPVDELLGLVARSDLRPGTMLRTSSGESKPITDLLLALISEFLEARNDSSKRLLSEEVLLLLPGPEQEYHKQAAHEAPALASFGVDAKVSIGNSRVQLSSSRRVAWVVANLAVEVQRNGDQIKLPLRGSFVLEKGQIGKWQIVQIHISASLSESEISERVFGPAEQE